jgi:hypothetical protein
MVLEQKICNNPYPTIMVGPVLLFINYNLRFHC